MSRMSTRLAMAMLILTAACASRAPTEGVRAQERASEVLARGEGFTITADDFRARLAEQSDPVRARYSTPDMRREFLSNLVRFEVLAAEARRQGLERHPDVVLMTKKLIVQRLVKDRFAYEGDKAEKEQAFETYVQSLLKQANVQVNDAALESLNPRPDAVKLDAVAPEPPPMTK